jgi:hypothetical protein
MSFQQSNYSQIQNKPTNYDAYSKSIPQLLKWASDVLDLEITSLEQMVTGAIFCHLLDACHPDSVRMNKVNWKANCETEYITNFKIFQQGLLKNNIEKTININRLANGKQNELNELLQWIYGHYRQYKDYYNGKYNAKRKRNGQKLIFTKHNIKQNYRNMNYLKNKYNQMSSSSQCSSSKNSIRSDTNSQIDNYSDYNDFSSNHYNYSRSKDNIRFNNNMQNQYNMNNNNYPNSQFQNVSRMRNKSKGNYKYEQKFLNNNYSNHNNNLNIRNRRNINKEFNSSEAKSVNNNFNNKNTNNNFTRKRNNSKNSKIKNVNIFNSYNNNKKNNNNNLNIIKRNVSPNIFQNNYDCNQNQYNNQISQSNEEESSHIIIDNESNNSLDYDEEDDDYKEKNLNVFCGLNSEEMKYLREEEKKEGNRVKDLKKIIRNLRISKISNDKKIKELNNKLINVEKLKNFYLNKLRDIEYLYFNPIIKNNNENKNSILRQLLCAEEDSTIYIDENNFAFLPNKKNDSININTNNELLKKNNSQPQSSKKNKFNEIDINKTYNGKMINNNNTIDYNNDKIMHNVNYSSKKNFNKNYSNNLNDMFDSLDNNGNNVNNDNDIMPNCSNDTSMNVPNNYNNNTIISSNIINPFNNKNNNNNINNIIINPSNHTKNNTQIINESEEDTISNFNNSNYNYNNADIKTKIHRIIPIKINNCDRNIIIYPNNINHNSINDITTTDVSQNNINYNQVNGTYDSSIQLEKIKCNIQANSNVNDFENRENFNDNCEPYNQISSQLNSERKPNKADHTFINYTDINRNKICKSEQKNRNIDIVSKLLNDPLNLQCLK